MKRILKTAAILLALAVTTILWNLIAHPSQKVQAQAGCSTSQLVGQYGGYEWGTDSSGRKTNRVDSWSFDGNGNYVLVTTAMNNGVIQNAVTQQGSYNAFTDPTTGACRVFYTVPGQPNENEFAEGSAFTWLYKLAEGSGNNVSGVMTKQ